ncbi:NAD(P)H-binding protein [Acuticoccus sp. MNP-M23]|uniref:NAD(P)-dependent oxidoreductase n=1 Tax=Acuticoccus sp. MNP-M23 TaxID=3072793 RepID=UPI002814C351|nr:NAD(P)H-binding protein [Acuticoccus sp. MNP-M23]WMS41933.1 NAD(P)H-binding protein [Acuticoccus sp. MNP-M23]
MTNTAPIVPPARIVVFGATGNTGRAVLRQGNARGFDMAGVDLGKADDTSGDWDEIVANVLEDDLAPALEGASAVISCLGVGHSIGTLADPPPLYSKGTARIVEAMGTAGVKRIVVISATMVAANDRGPLMFRLGMAPALTRVLDQMEEMERELAASGLDWTAARPGWLLDKPATEDFVLSEGEIADGLIRTRIADLAGVMLDCVEQGTFSRGYPAPARKETDEDESNEAVLKAMMA